MTHSGYFKLCVTLLLVLIVKLNVMAGLITDVPVISSELLYDGKARLGEGAFWNHKTNTFWWIDIEGRAFHIYNAETKTNKSYPVPQRIGTVVPDKNGNAIVALQDGIYRLYLHDGSLELLAKALHDPARFRFNDGKCDPAGRLWVGSMSMDGSRETARLYRFDHDYTLKPMYDGVTISNGIVWTADKTKMYYIDTPTRQIKEFKYNNITGAIEFSRVAVEIPGELGYPDGMSIDEKGRLWVGHWAGQAVYCWDPITGQMVAKVEVAAKNVTAPAFGGENLDKLFITTASAWMSEADLEQFPKSGGVFIAFPGAKGVKSHFFGK